MTNEKTHTQLLLVSSVDSWAAGPRLPRRPAQPASMAVSEEDLEKIKTLLIQRGEIPNGKEFKRQRDRLSCQIHRLRQPMSEEARAKDAAHTKAWNKNNPEKRKAIALRYYYRHRPPLKPARVLVMNPTAIYTRQLRKDDIQFTLKDRIRASMNRAFRRQWIEKPARTEELLGCTLDEAKAHIESQFAPGMSWDVRASFVIDHHVPIVAFDLRDAEEVKWAFNWRNLQPLTRHDNAVKQATLPTPLPPWLPAHIALRVEGRA